MGPPAPDEDKSAEYDAFLSYAHRDRQVTTAIQKGLHQIGRRLGRLRALRVFRDDTNLTASPDLWGKITEAMDRSRFMIVVLSPQSAGSHWVSEEIGYWLTHRGHDQLMLVLAGGSLRWDAAQQRFEPGHSDAAPPVLTEPGSLPSEPLYIDVSDDAPWDLGSLVFRDKVTALAAPIHGKPKDALAGEDLREQRQFRRLRAAAATGLVVLTVVAVVAALVAVGKQHEASRRLRDAVVAKLNAEGASMLAGTTPGGDVRALQELLAANAIQANGVPILNAQIARFTTEKIRQTPSEIFRVAYSPDGRRVVTAQANKTVRQWDSSTGKPIGGVMEGHTDRVKKVGYTPDGHAIASAALDGTMRLFDADTGAPLNPAPKRVAPLSALAISSDGKTVFTGGHGGAVQLWDAHSGQLLTAVQVFNDPPTTIDDLEISHDGNLLAIDGGTAGIEIYDVKSLKPHGAPIKIQGPYGSTGSAFQCAFSPDGHTLAVAGDDLQLWNVETGSLIRQIRLGKSFGAYDMAVAFSPDGRRLATGREDGALQLWNPDSGEQLGQTMSGHTGMVEGVAFSPNGRQLATTSIDGTLRLWSATVGQPMRGPESHLFRVEFSPSGRRVGAVGEATIEQWDPATGQPLAALPINDMASTTASYLDDRRIATAAVDGIVRVLDTDTGQPLQPPVHLDVSGKSINFAFSRDGRMVASGPEDGGAVQLWEMATGKALAQPLTVDTAKSEERRLLESLAFSSDGHHLVGGYDDGLRLWNTSTREPEGSVLHEAGHLNPTMSVAFSRDGDVVAGGGVDGIALWDTATRKQLPHSPLRGKGIVFTMDFGVRHQLASGGVDAQLHLWDTATGAPAAAPQSESETVIGVALSPDGRMAATTTADGNLTLSPALADTGQLCDKLSANMSHRHWNEWVSPGIDYITLCPGLPIAAD